MTRNFRTLLYHHRKRQRVEKINQKVKYIAAIFRKELQHYIGQPATTTSFAPYMRPAVEKLSLEDNILKDAMVGMK